MSENFREKANQVVEQFKDHLGNSRSSISSNDYEALSNLVSAAIAEELTESADEMEAIVHRIRKAVEKPDLGL